MAFKTKYQFWLNQARSQVLRFGEANYIFKVERLLFLRAQQNLGGTKRFGDNFPRMSPVSASLGRTVARNSSIGGLHVCARGLDILKFCF